MVYYNLRVTQQPFLMPYVLHTARYMAAPLFFWQQPPPTPDYPNEQMRQFHTGTEYGEYADQLGRQSLIGGAVHRAAFIAWAYLRPVLLLIPFLASLLMFRQRSRGPMVRASLWICVGVLLVHVTICPWMRIAYMAPLLGLLFVLVGLGMRQLHSWRWDGQPVGRALVRALVLTQTALAAPFLISYARNNARLAISGRRQVVAQLEQKGGRHLVLVRYGAGHSPHEEWVYNAADVDGAPVIFARDLGEHADRALLDYYPGRSAWRLEIGNRDAKLTALPHRSLDATADVPVGPITPEDYTVASPVIIRAYP